MPTKKPFTVRNSTFVVLLLNVILSVVASLSVMLVIRWDIKAFPGFADTVLRLFLASLTSSVIACLISGSSKVVIRYTSMRSLSKLAEEALIKEVLLAICGICGLIMFKEFSHPVLVLLADFMLTFTLLVMIRLILVIIYNNMQDDVAINVGRLCVLVYGTSDKSVAMVARLEQSRHYVVAGYVSPNRPDQGLILLDHTVYFIDDVESLRQLKVSMGVEGIIFAKDEDVRNDNGKIVQMALQCGIHILTTPKIEEMRIEGLTQSNFKSVGDIDFIPDGMTELERSFKRFVDFILSFILIIVFFPLMLICAIVIRIGGGPGPILYKQERIGRFGRPFNIYKFRTMIQDAEPNGAALYSGDDDPRLTKAGKFLRQHHLDELPQLFNVFKGEMAFVGYRPERKFYIDKIMDKDPRYYYLYQIRPGVTSYATLKNGYTDTMEKMLRRLEFDLYYLRHRSAWFDVKILWNTFANIVFGKKF